MIHTPTTFVVGAGASKSFGLPLGGELLNSARSLEPNRRVYRWLMQLGISPKELNEFIADVKGHPADSIDAFLETRQQHPRVVYIGRYVIACLMADSMVRGKSGEPELWLDYIIRRMYQGAPTFEAFMEGNQSVRFVTFNFDTYIEARLRTALISIYRRTFGECEQFLALNSVEHVHGRLPELPAHIDKGNPFSEPISGQVLQEWITWASEAAPNINVVFDPLEQARLDRARAAVQQARVVCFLGFGYHDDNLKRLGIPETTSSSRYVFGSAFGLREGEKARIARRFLGGIKFGETTDTCIDVLGRFDVFVD